MRRTWILGILIVIVVVCGIAGAIYQSGTVVQVAAATRGDIREFVDERGKTRLPRLYRITMPQDGRIQEITLEEGNRVEKKQVVAQIISEDLANAVAEAQAVVERLDAAIAENDDVAVESSLAVQAKQFVESMNNTVDAARTRTESSSKRSEFAETNLGRVQELRRSGARTEDDLDRATLAYWEGQLGYRQDLLVWEAMKSIRAATALLPKMVGDYISHKGLTRAVLEKQKSEAQARLRQIMTERDRGTMRSPVTGTVLERHVRNEQQLGAGTEIMVIGQLEQLEVETDVLSQDVVRIEAKDPVEIYGPAVGAPAGLGVSGAVDKVYPAGFTKISSLGVEQQRVKVVIRLTADAAAQLRKRDVGVDFRVRTRIFTDQKTQTLLVPRSALFRGPDGGWQLFVVRGRRAVLQPVEVGLMNDQFVEITKGVAENQLVILTPDTNLSHGSRVKPLQR